MMPASAWNRVALGWNGMIRLDVALSASVLATAS
jgi:hypothetical protein